MTVGEGVTDVVIVPGSQARHPKWRIKPLILSARPLEQVPGNKWVF